MFCLGIISLTPEKRMGRGSNLATQKFFMKRVQPSLFISEPSPVLSWFVQRTQWRCTYNINNTPFIMTCNVIATTEIRIRPAGFQGAYWSANSVDFGALQWQSASDNWMGAEGLQWPHLMKRSCTSGDDINKVKGHMSSSQRTGSTGVSHLIPEGPLVANMPQQWGAAICQHVLFTRWNHWRKQCDDWGTYWDQLRWN